jgi:hypothetical protein
VANSTPGRISGDEADAEAARESGDSIGCGGCAMLMSGLPDSARMAPATMDLVALDTIWNLQLQGMGDGRRSHPTSGA